MDLPRTCGGRRPCHPYAGFTAIDDEVPVPCILLQEFRHLTRTAGRMDRNFADMIRLRKSSHSITPDCPGPWVARLGTAFGLDRFEELMRYGSRATDDAKVGTEVEPNLAEVGVHLNDRGILGNRTAQVQSVIKPTAQGQHDIRLREGTGFQQWIV